MLYLIGLGLSKESFTYEVMNAIKNCRKVYLENYTVELPYGVEELQQLIGKKINEADRSFVESNEIIKESKEQNVALLIYGSPLMATTHISLIQEAKKAKVAIRVLHNASILDAVAETGLQLYKFGKIVSLPKPAENFNPQSFVNIIKENQSINAHTLLLVDIGLKFKDSLKQLVDSCKDNDANLDKIVVCEHLGLKDSRIYYNNITNLKKLKIKAPFCFILPGKLHFMEGEVLEGFK